MGVGETHPQGASLKLLSLIAKNGLKMVARFPAHRLIG